MGEALIVRRGGGSGSHTVTLVSLIPSGAETITYTGTASGTASITSGTGSVLLSTGTYTFTSSDTIWTSGTVAITGDTTINCWFGTPVYWYGNECVALTGGWIMFSTAGTFKKSASYMRILSNSAGTVRYAGTSNQISLSGYSRLLASWSREGASSRYGRFGTSTTTTTSAGWTQYKSGNGTFSYQTDYLELTDFSSAYIRIADNGASANGVGSSFQAIWFD